MLARVLIFLLFLSTNLIASEFYNEKEKKTLCDKNIIFNPQTDSIEVQILKNRKWVENLFKLVLEFNQPGTKTSDKNVFNFSIKDSFKKNYKSKVKINYKKDNVVCKFDARVKITGDGWWHLDWVAGKPFASIQVKLLNGNINNIVNFKLLLPNVPDFFVRIMPGRFTILHSVIAWPIILSVLFILIKNLKRKYYILNNLEYFFIIFIILAYSVSHYKTFIKLKNQYINNTSQTVSLYDDKFWNDAKKIKFDGYLLTSYSSSTIAMRKILKPIILDVSSLDFVPYFPNTAKKMSLIIEKIYGIPFNNPPLDIRNRPFLTDENIKSNFENYSEEKWIKLSKEFNFHGVVIPSDWNINLTPILIGNKFTLYII